MQEVPLHHPTWLTSVPHLVSPHPDEWLLGLLLRCDEANGWTSKTTLAHTLRLGPEKSHRRWSTETPNLVVIPPNSLNLDYLAQLLVLPKRTLLATTYHTELSRLYGVSNPHPQDINPSFAFHLCPECVAKDRLLRRMFTLPHLTLCLQHQVVLVKQCQCGTWLRLFHRWATPFTCHICGTQWADLPRIAASPDRLALEQHLLSWYEFFFSHGTPLLLERMRQHIEAVPPENRKNILPVLERRYRSFYGSFWQSWSLHALVALLVNCDISLAALMDESRRHVPRDSWVHEMNASPPTR
jgi:hypothetical protein